MYLFERRNQLGPDGINLREEAYFDFGGAAWCMDVSKLRRSYSGLGFLPTLIFVAPFTDFSKELAISTLSNVNRLATNRLLPRETTGSSLTAHTTRSFLRVRLFPKSLRSSGSWRS
jgi:hypothetical protein